MKKVLAVIVVVLITSLGLYLGAKIVMQPETKPAKQSFLNTFLNPEITDQNSVLKPAQIPSFEMPIKVPRGFKMYVYADVPN